MEEKEFNSQLVSIENKLAGFAFTLTLNKDDAKDLVQETIYKAIKYRTQFAANTNIKSWTYTIMKNTFINNYRKNIRHVATFDYDKDLSYVSNIKDTTKSGPDSVYFTHELNKIIDGLEDAFKIPFKMHVEGYKYHEIADKLGLKLGTVKSRIFFSRKKLMDAITEEVNTLPKEHKNAIL